MVKSKRDPSVGAAWLAWYAIMEGDEPVECVWQYISEAKDKLVDLSRRLSASRRLPDNLTAEDQAFLSADLMLLLVALDAAANGGDTFNALRLARRPGGRPNYIERAHCRDDALQRFEALRAESWKVDAAAKQVEAETGVKRSTLLDWRRKTRQQREVFRARRPSK